MENPSLLELQVPPRSRREMIAISIIVLVMIAATALAVFDLITRDAIIMPLLWLGFVGLLAWQQISYEGDYRKFAINFLGAFLGTEFLTIASDGNEIPKLRSEVRIFGRHFVRWSLSLDEIISVEWGTGQATDMAKRDMNDWCVYLRFKDDSKKEKSFRPGQSLHVIGPAWRKTDIEVFGLAFIDLLRHAGLQLKEAEGAPRRVVWQR